jgi:glyoxylase-like metal-dependent hydrolase (beta-lactamase superfamily II)
MRLALAALLWSSVAWAAPPEKLADGVYAIIHPDATPDWPNGNTLVVVGERGVLVLDANYLPSAARADIAAIKKLTPRPVKWLVNSHWHYDHNNGNAEYRKAFPGVEIVAHVETRRLMDANCARYNRGLGAKSSAELARFEYAGPTVTFEREMRIDLGGREARVVHLGRGNTPGDVIVHLPREKIVAAGDLVVAPVPYAWNSYPLDWIETLRALRGLSPAVLVPGHGPVMRDMGYVEEVEALLGSVVRQVGELQAGGKTLDEVRAALDLRAFRERMVGGDAAQEEVWTESVMKALVERAWQATRGGI